MKANRRQVHWQPWLTMLLTVIAVWLAPQRAMATFVDETYNYLVTLNGSNKVKIQVPVYDERGADCWVKNGKLYYSVKNDETGNFSSEVLAFRWYSDESSHDNDDSDLWCKHSTEAGGSFEVTQGNSGNHFAMTSGSGEMRRLIYESAETYTIYVVWTLPYELLGKTLKFRWNVRRNGNGRSDSDVSGLSDVTITIPKAENINYPQLTMATIAFSEKGKLEIPWFIATNKLQKAQYQYTTYDGRQVTESLPTDQSGGTIYLDATVPHKDFRVVVDYKDKDDYYVRNIPSAVQTLDMIHAPVGLRTVPTGNGKAAVRLLWQTEYPGQNDISSADVFEVQRSITGKEEDFVSIGAEAFNQDKSTYEYVDSTLVQALTEGHFNGKGTLDKLTYRIRRAVTQTWGWEGNPTAATSTCVIDNLHLTRFASYSAQWEDERAYTVRVAWDYANEYNAVLDNRASMMLRIITTNRAGETVDTTTYTLTQEELQNRFKIVNLARPCVDYKIEMYVERGTSPVPLFDEVEPYFFPIRKGADWVTFLKNVKNAEGKHDVNARLYIDIETNLMIADSKTYVYRGTFDGNGHTIEFTLNRDNYEFQAPFRCVGDATIKNLHVKGTVTTNSKFGAGLISWVQDGATVLVENCRSSVTINSTMNGDATNGGIIALPAENTNVTLRNCQFDGSFEGENCHSNGGLIGYCGYKGCTATIENCLFSPKRLGTKRDRCATFARTSDVCTLIEKNNYATQEYNNTIVINNADDWVVFRNEVVTAAGNYDVNAVLNSDIATTQSVGLIDNIPWRGTFNGNGHTLSLDIKGGTSPYIAPFYKVKSCTIKNLKVNGDVRGGIHSAGLIGSCENSAVVNIENVISNTNVWTTDRYAGGIIGHAGYATVRIEDCKSYGRLDCNISGGYAGAIIGWAESSDKWEMHRVYEYITSLVFTHTGFCYYNYNSGTPWGNNIKSTTCISAHDWGEMKMGCRNINISSAVAMFNDEQPGSWREDNNAPVMENDAFDDIPTADALIASLGSDWMKDGDVA
ncbi:MAG: hypothetical protein IKR18_08575, partial [Bacteroidaceae bacterium]|nr:hypothetical protein [Bacteroidaceae bacterium]